MEYSAPTQSLLQKYLREVYDIHITISRWFECSEDPERLIGFITYLGGEGADEINKKLVTIVFETYEEALEKGLIEGLKIAKKKN